MIQRLITIIAAHGCTAWEDNGRLMAVSEYSRDGRAESEVVELPVSRRAVLAWLGY